MDSQLKKTHLEVPVQGAILRGYLDEPAAPEPHPLLIMFHGFTGDCTEAKFLLTRLARHLAGAGIACLRLSFQGSGESDGDFERTSCLGQAREGEAILDFARTLPAVDASRIALLGMSMGGCAAALLARDRQEHLKGLILLAPAFRYVEKYRARYGADGFYWHGNLKVGRNFLEDGLTSDFKGALQALRIPVAFFHGTEDTSVVPDVSREYSTYPEDAELTLIEGTDHAFDTRQGFAELQNGVESAAKRMLNLNQSKS